MGRAPHKTGDARGRRSWRSSFLGDPSSKFLCGKLGKAGRKKKEQKSRKREGVQTAELDRRDQVTATVPGPVPFARGKRGRLSGDSPATNSSPRIFFESLRVPDEGRRIGWFVSFETSRNDVISSGPQKQNCPSRVGRQ